MKMMPLDYHTPPVLKLSSGFGAMASVMSAAFIKLVRLGKADRIEWLVPSLDAPAKKDAAFHPGFGESPAHDACNGSVAQCACGFSMDKE